MAVAIVAGVTMLSVVGANAAEHLAATIEVSATVASNCRLTVNPLVFGSYDPLGSNSISALDATTPLMLTCTRDTQASINMDSGKNAVKGSPQRFLASGPPQLGYLVFRDSARTQNWGIGADALEFVSSGGKDGQSLTVFGRIPPGQEVPAGVYSDVLTATVDF